MQSKYRLISGFTIIELLVVVVVIAILAAINIISYNGITNRSMVSAAMGDLITVRKKFEIYKIDNGFYPTRTDDTTWKQILTDSVGALDGVKTFVICRTDTGADYTVIAWRPLLASTDASTGKTMYFVSSRHDGVSTATYPGQGSAGTVAQAACSTIGANTNGLWSFQL
jgi:prepilin-type N-terminal cleavage/methylation domain-containing protein